MVTATMEKKSLMQPDDVVRFEKGELATVRIGGATVARAVFEPGWRWSTHVGAGTGEQRCQVPHLGYVAEGRLAIEMADGNRIELGPGDTAFIPAGHDGWTVGDQRCIFLEFPPPAA
jgi:quercetin dioxygenase-like cupin family protein